VHRLHKVVALSDAPHSDGIVQMSRIIGLTLEKIIPATGEEYIQLVYKLISNCRAAEDDEFEKNIEKLRQEEEKELRKYPIKPPNPSTEQINKINMTYRNMIRMEYAQKYYDECMKCITKHFSEERDIKGVLE